MTMSENKNAYPIYYDASIKDGNIAISGMPDFKCGDSLCLININKMTTGIVSETMDYRYPGLYVGDKLASQLLIDMDPQGDVVHVTKMNKMYNVYFDSTIEDHDIVICGLDDFKCEDHLCLINLWHITSGVVKSQIPSTPDKPSGLYVGVMLALELGFDITIDDNDYVIDVVKIDPKKSIENF